MKDKFFYENFGEETKIKLELLSGYIKSWLPVFLMQNHVKNIKIIDFFCGPGKDEAGNYGSPLKILEILDEFYKGSLSEKVKSKEIELLFNDKESSYIKALENHISNNFKELNDKLNIRLESQEFKSLFNKEKKSLHNSANFIFLDQFGIKEVTKEIFKDFLKIPGTDFIFFISSHSIRRFLDTEEFQSTLWWMNQNIKNEEPKYIHRTVVQEYKELAGKDNYVIPFSIKKGNNVYGLIFCSKHILAADKFLRIAWNENKINGEANFDINEDFRKQLSFFEKENLTKIQDFEKSLQDKIQKEIITDNIQIYKYTISNGFIPKYAKDALKKLKEEKIIQYKGQMPISYDSCISQKKFVKIELIKKV